MPTVAFLGSHPLGVACLDQLHDHPDYEVRVVVTYPPDADTWWEGSVHDTATSLGYRTLTLDERDELLSVPVDYLLSVYYPEILPPAVLDHPAVAPLNLHQAELPRYRGSNVFSHAILDAREDDHWRHGTTIHLMTPTVDAGPILDRRFVEITESDTARSVYEKTCEASRALFAATLDRLPETDVRAAVTPQSAFDGPRYYNPKSSLDGRKAIPTERLADPAAATAVYDLVRALEFPPFEPAYTEIDGHRIYLTTEGFDGVTRE